MSKANKFLESHSEANESNPAAQFKQAEQELYDGCTALANQISQKYGINQYVTIIGDGRDAENTSVLVKLMAKYGSPAK